MIQGRLKTVMKAVTWSGVQPRACFQIIIERLRDQADNLAYAFDDIDQRKEYQEAMDGSLVVRCRGRWRRKRRLVHRIDRCSCRRRDRYERTRRRTRSFADIQVRDNCLNDFARMRSDRDRDRPFVGGRLLERGELAVEQLRRHEMIGARGDAARDEILIALEIDQPDVLPLADENVAIGPLERRAGDDAMIAGAPRGVDPIGDGMQPGPAILVGERLAMVHLLDVSFGMKPVAVFVKPVQTMREHGADRALARAGNAHHDED